MSWDEALRLSSEAYAAGARPSLISVSSLMKWFQKGEQWKLAVAASERAQKIKVDPIFCSILSDVYGKAGLWAQSLLVLFEQRNEGVEVEVFSCGVAIAASTKAVKWREASALLSALHVLVVRCGTKVANAAMGAASWERMTTFLADLRSREVQLDCVALNSVLSSCDKSSKWPYILHILSLSLTSQAAIGTFPDEYSYNAVISADQRAAQWQLTLQVLRHFPQLRMEVDTFGITGALQAVAVAVQWRHGLDLLQAKCLEGVGGTAWSPAMAACERGSQWQEVLVLIRELGHRLFVPDLLHYNAVMSSCQSCPQWPSSLTFLEELRKKRLQTDATLSSNAMTGIMNGQWSQVLSFFASLADAGALPVDVTATNAIIISSLKGCHWDAALLQLERYETDVLSYVLILDACACYKALWAAKITTLLGRCLEASLRQLHMDLLQRGKKQPRISDWHVPERQDSVR